MDTIEQQQALQNMADSAQSGITVHQKPGHDKRRTVPKFFANIGNETISPTLDYSNLNHFLLGFSKARRRIAAAPEELARLIADNAIVVDALEDCTCVLDSANRHTNGKSTAFAMSLEKARNAAVIARERQCLLTSSAIQAQCPT